MLPFFYLPCQRFLPNRKTIMKIGIIGNGKMGQAIGKAAEKRNHQVILVVDLENQDDMNAQTLGHVDVVFEFTHPTAAPHNIKTCFNYNIPVVCGTTGWLDQFDELADYCRQHNKTLFYAPNFSLGVNILSRINRSLAKMMNQFPQYQVEIEETHHIHKIDAPSGTAISLAEDIISAMDRIDQWEKAGQNQKGALPVRSIRESDIPGRHVVSFESEFDKLEIHHSSKSREGFAMGAILAGEFILGKQGVYGMDDLLSL